MIHQKAFEAMDSPCELRFLPPRTGEAAAAADALVREVRRVEEKFSGTQEDSIVSRINRSAGRKRGLKVDDETAALLDYAAICHDHSGGLFDLTTAPLAALWDFGASEIAPPDPKALRAALRKVGWNKLRWERPRLVLPVAGMALDFSALLKEYAADSCARLAAELGLRHGLVELGGVARVFGPPPGASAWTVSVRNPRNPRSSLVDIRLARGALAGSGDFEQRHELAGRPCSHLLDPFTGRPVSGLASVSVIADQALIAGSTAAIAMLKGEAGKAWLDGIGLPHVRIDHEGNVSGKDF